MARNPLTQYRGGGLLGGGLDPLFSLHRDMNRLFDEVMGGGVAGGGLPLAGGQGQFINAHMSVSETENEIRVAAELPGVREEDIEVSLDEDMLTIRGEKKMERQDEKENFHFVERSFGTFQRSIRLPFPVEPDQVRASFDNGVLTVTLPKSARQDRTRRIQVQRGAAGSDDQRMIQGQAASGDQQRQGGDQQRQGGAPAAGGDQQRQAGQGESRRAGGSGG